MSNEDLVMLAQDGDCDALEQLWSQVERLIWKQAGRWAGLGGTEAQDLVQAGFLAVLEAAGTYDPDRGTKFTTWLFPYLKQEFSAATGRQTQRTRKDPLETAVSLDAPVEADDPDGATLGDLIPDPAAELAMDDISERDRAQHLRHALELALAGLPEGQQEAIRGKYYRGQRVDTKAHAAALRALRNPSVSQALRAYL